MTDLLGYTGAAARAWLESLLRARLHDGLRLAAAEGAWRITLNGQERALTLPMQFGAYAPGTADMPCGALADDDAPLGAGLAAPGVAALPAPLVDTDAARFGYDVPGLAYWMLTRAEEIGRDDEYDRHGRFPAQAAHAVRHGYLERPIVDEWLILLGRALGRLWPGLTLIQHDFRMHLSHDVDLPARYGYCGAATLAKRMAGDLRRGLPIGTVARAPLMWRAQRRALHPRDPYNSFERIMDESDARGLTSAFYFIPEDAPGGIDPRYDFDTPPIRALLRRIAARGHEIGLHPHYGSFLDAQAIARQAATLARVCAEEGIARAHSGGRMHYLQWRMPDTPAAWAAAGQAYDASLGYAERPGFRAGTAFDFPGFDPIARAPLNITLRPLAAMEVSVIDPVYLGLGTGAEALARFAAIKHACRAVAGPFTFLWHNDGLNTAPLRRLYTGVLDA